MKPQPIGRYTPTPSYEELQAEIERLRLTDEEREAVQEVIDYLQPAGQKHQNHVAATLRGLLERLA